MTEKPIAIVTGASSGIGAVFAEQLAERGYDLVLVARRAERLEQLASQLKQKFGANVECRPTDLSDQAAITAFADELAARPHVDMLVNSAGFGTNGFFAKVDANRIAQELNVDMVALVLLTRAVLPGMLARNRGDIINVSSVGGFNAAPYFATYSGIKAGVINFTESIYAEVRNSGVRVQVLCPGPVPTEFNEVADVGDEMPAPGFMVQSAEDCVAGSLRDLEKGKPVSIPQTACRWMFNIIKRLPLSMRLAFSSSMIPQEDAA